MRGAAGPHGALVGIAVNSETQMSAGAGSSCVATLTIRHPLNSLCDPARMARWQRHALSLLVYGLACVLSKRVLEYVVAAWVLLVCKQSAVDELSSWDRVCRGRHWRQHFSHVCRGMRETRNCPRARRRGLVVSFALISFVTGEWIIRR
jgi:hypothetical protein